MLRSKQKKSADVDIANSPVIGAVCQFEFSDRITLQCVNPKHRDCRVKIIAWEARRLPLLLELLTRGELVGNAKKTAEEFQANLQ